MRKEWPRRKILSWPNFEEVAAIFAQGVAGDQPSILARGQAQWQWRLESSLERALPREIDESARLAIEAKILSEFQLRCEPLMAEKQMPAQHQLFEWWALLQRYGAPTRMIDWTTSIHVAAYFAVVDHWDHDGALWLLSPWVVLEGAKILLGADTPLEPLVTSNGAPTAVVPVPARLPTDRMSIQKSHFTISTRLVVDQTESILQMFQMPGIDSGEQVHLKLHIPKRLKPEFLERLREMGITGSALFPGLDGIGRSVSELVRLAASRSSAV